MVTGTPVIRTPIASGGVTNTPKLPDQATIQRAAAGLPNSVFTNLSQITTPAALAYGQVSQNATYMSQYYQLKFSSKTDGNKSCSLIASTQ